MRIARNAGEVGRAGHYPPRGECRCGPDVHLTGPCRQCEDAAELAAEPDPAEGEAALERAERGYERWLDQIGGAA